MGLCPTPRSRALPLRIPSLTTLRAVRGTMHTTPMLIMMVVTMEEVEMAMVEMISPSSLLALTSFCSSAFSAQGSFRLEMLPVTKLK